MLPVYSGTMIRIVGFTHDRGLGDQVPSERERLFAPPTAGQKQFTELLVAATGLMLLWIFAGAPGVPVKE